MNFFLGQIKQDLCVLMELSQTHPTRFGKRLNVVLLLLTFFASEHRSDSNQGPSFPIVLFLIFSFEGQETWELEKLP